MNPAIISWLNDAIIASFCSSVLFAVGVSFIFPWWRSMLGRSLVIVDILWAASFLPLFLSEVTSWTFDGMFFTGYFAATLSVTAAATVWRLWAIAREQRRGRRHK